MARDMTFDLGTFSIASYIDKHFVLTVTTSVSVSLSDDYPGVLTAAELCNQVKAGSLWITRAGSCNVKLSIVFDDFLDDDFRVTLEHMVTESFEKFPVWSVLGLDLRREYNQFYDLPGSATPYTYSIQHLRPNSGLVAPDYVQHAYLSTLFCGLSFGTKKDVAQGPRTESVVMPGMSRILDLRLTSRKLRKFARRKQHWEGAQIVPRPKKSWAVTLKVSPEQLRKIARKKPVIYSLAPDSQKERLEILTHTALNSLLGLKKRFSGVQFLARTESSSLLEMAPAVWNARYFLDVISRVQLGPFISSALGSLTNTDSSNLRHKLQALAVDPTEKLHRQIVALTLRSTRITKVNPRGPKTKSAHLPDAYGALEIDEIQGQDDGYGQESPYSTQDPFSDNFEVFQAGANDDAAVATPGPLQGDNLPYGYDEYSNNPSLIYDQDPSYSSGLRSPDGQLKSGQLQHLDLVEDDFMLCEDQLESTPHATEILGQVFPQDYQRFSTIFSEEYSDTELETTDHLLLDEAYLRAEEERAEEERAEALDYDNLSFEPTGTHFLHEDDDTDEIYLATERKLVELLASTSEPKQLHGGDLTNSDEIYLATERQLLELLVLRTEPETATC